MFNFQHKKRSAYTAADLAKLDATLDDYWEKSRALESETINDLEKYLWLANGAAATVSIGYIQAKATVAFWQYAGAWAFVSGIVMLVVLKFVSSLKTSRDRYRFQDAASRFNADKVTDDVFDTVRDRTFRVLKRAYLVLQWGAGMAFLAGAILTLIGVGGCSTNTHQITITKYPLQCLSGEIKNSQCPGGQWVAMNSYKKSYTLLLEKQQVVTLFLDEPKTYRNCVILNTDNWRCTYDDGSGSFGFRKGTHFQEPGSQTRIYVSRFRWWRAHLADMFPSLRP